MVAYLAVAMVITAAIAAIGTYIVQNIQFNHRRQEMVNATQYAQGGAAIACLDMTTAYTNGANSGNFLVNLASGSTAYAKNGTLSTSAQSIYERTISSPFTNQTVLARVTMTNSSSPTAACRMHSAASGHGKGPCRSRIRSCRLIPSTNSITMNGTSPYKSCVCPYFKVRTILG